MYMLIKDNRIFRRKNKKLLKNLHDGIERSAGVTEEVGRLRLEN